VEEGRVATPLEVTVEPGWVSPEYARRLPASILVADAQGTGDRTFVTVLVPLEGDAAIDLEGLAHLQVGQTEQFAA